MSVSLAADGKVVLAGPCPSEDAEQLLQLLLANPGASVDWRTCTAAHPAVLQVLLAAAVPVVGPAADGSLARWIDPLLGRPGS